MPQPFSFLHNHSGTVWLVAISAGVLHFLWVIYRHWRYGIVFPSMKSVQPRFHENMASGRSLKNWITRLGGASNCLRVTVTDTEVWVRPFFPFNLLASTYDLSHRIPRNSITTVAPYRTALRSEIRIRLEYRVQNDRTRCLQLRLRHPEIFQAALANPPPLP